MENISSIHLQEVVISSSDPKISTQISKLEKAGKLQKIAPRIYSSNFENTPEEIIRFLEGPGPIEGDNPLSGELYASQQERALLENLQVSRRPGPQSKTLTLPEVE